MEKLKLDFGCGVTKRDDWIGIDFFAANNPQICADIRAVPLEDGCASEITCFHVLEHIEGDGAIAVMNEMARLLVPGGTFEIRVPHPSHDSAMIQGHHHVFTPSWWRDMRDKNWLCGKLMIDSIEEVPDPQAVEDGAFNDESMPAAKLRYLRNVYVETKVLGHKP